MIHKRLTGQISDDELLQLKQWLNAVPGNPAIAREVEQIWNAANAKGQQPEVETALHRFQKARRESVPATVPRPATNAKVVTLRSILLRAAVAVGLLLGAFYLLQETGQSNDLMQLTTQLGQQQSVDLQDGSSVWLNQSSTLDYPTTFADDQRTVQLHGEAFFDVADDTQRPFTITTPALDIEVVGTSFNVFAYPGKNTEEVVVASGKVKVEVKNDDTSYLLEPGDRLIYNRSNSQATTSKDNQQNAQAWRTGILTFHQTPLSEVRRILEKHFDIRIHIDNKALHECPFTAPAFKNATRQTVLETLATAFSMEVEPSADGAFRFLGGACD